MKIENLRKTLNFDFFLPNSMLRNPNFLFFYTVTKKLLSKKYFSMQFFPFFFLFQTNSQKKMENNVALKRKMENHENLHFSFVLLKNHFFILIFRLAFFSITNRFICYLIVQIPSAENWKKMYFPNFFLFFGVCSEICCIVLVIFIKFMANEEWREIWIILQVGFPLLSV